MEQVQQLRSLLPWIGGTVVAILNICISAVAARLLFAAQANFGVGDFDAVLYWTVPLAILQGILFALLTSRFANIPLIGRFVAGIVVGALGTLLWSIFFVFFLFGPMYGAFSISPARVWMTASPTSMVTGVALLTLFKAARGEHPISRALLLSLLFPPLVGFLSFQFLVYGVGLEAFVEPNVTLVAAKWEPEEGSLQIDDPLPSLTASEVAQLRSFGLGGHLVVTGASARGTALRKETVRVVVVMHQPTTEVVQLPVPKRDDVIYLQNLSGEWQQFPPDIAMAESHLRVESLEFQGEPVVEFWLELDSSLSLVGGLSWDEEPEDD